MEALEVLVAQILATLEEDLFRVVLVQMASASFFWQAWEPLDAFSAR